MDQKSKERLKGVDERLVRVAELAFQRSPYQLTITEGMRTIERQRQLYAEKKTKTLNSKHLTGKALDFAVYIDGKIVWDMKYYKQVAEVFKAVAKELNIPITCGADWGWDGPHIELKE
jgi:peptidoglycan L-alanyl-D-glutamate endopeptidase CwlK